VGGGLTDLVTINGGGHLVQGPQKPRLHQLCNTNQRISSATAIKNQLCNSNQRISSAKAIRESDQPQHQTKQERKQHHLRWFITFSTSMQSHLTLIKKEKKIFLMYKEIQIRSDAKLYMRKGF
jgi:hypothetical protein